MRYLKDFCTNVFDTTGTINGKDFLLTWILVQIMQVLLILTVIGIFLIPFCIIGIVTMAKRRLNDIGKGSSYMILLFIPLFVNIIFFIYLCSAKGMKEKEEKHQQEEIEKEYTEKEIIYQKINYIKKIIFKVILIILTLALVFVGIHYLFEKANEKGIEELTQLISTN